MLSAGIYIEELVLIPMLKQLSTKITLSSAIIIIAEIYKLQ